MSRLSYLETGTVTSALDKALRKKEELERELRRITDFIEMYERLSGTDGENQEMVTRHDLSPDSRARRRTGRLNLRRPRPADFARIIESVLKDVNHPLPRGVLVAELEKRGHKIPTTSDKAQYLATILWRNKDRFENIEGKGYWLRGTSNTPPPSPPAPAPSPSPPTSAKLPDEAAATRASVDPLSEL
jgi:hypothetical protein